MRDERRTDLPHDQVADDQNGTRQNEENHTIDTDEILGGATPLGMEEEAIGQRPLNEPNAEREGLEDAVDAETIAEELEAENFDEETAAEVSPDLRRTDWEQEERERIENVEEMEANEAGNTTLGWTALVLSVVSLFFLPILTASVGVITGFFAYRNGARTLGIWAIVIGLFSIVMGLFLAPFVR